MQVNKISDTEFEVIKEVPVPETVSTKYSIDFLKNQEFNIIKSMNDFIDARKKELEEVRALLTEAENLGLKTSSEVIQESIILQETELNQKI